jgi:hypothetical protein
VKNGLCNTQKLQEELMEKLIDVTLNVHLGRMETLVAIGVVHVLTQKDVSLVTSTIRLVTRIRE